MSKIVKYLLFLLSLPLSSNVRATTDSSGSISGTLILDETWERILYVSFVETIEKEYTVSNDMIIARADIDSLGKFAIHLEGLPPEWSLLRLHLVKKGVPPASLVIGSIDENYYFIVAHRSSNITLHNSLNKPIFNKVKVSGAPYMNTFVDIINLSNYSNSIDYSNSLIEKEFIEDVVAEKLKLIADTCNNPLVSLYALYKTDFHEDYQLDPAFYERYLSKWEDDNSTYFESFRRQFPSPQITTWRNIMLLYCIVLLIVGYIIMVHRKRRKLNKLSVQERKILGLLQQGLSNQEISDACHIELSTVKSHVSSIFSKLKIKSRKEAMNLKPK